MASPTPAAKNKTNDIRDYCERYPNTEWAMVNGRFIVHVEGSVISNLITSRISAV